MRPGVTQGVASQHGSVDGPEDPGKDYRDKNSEPAEFPGQEGTVHYETGRITPGQPDAVELVLIPGAQLGHPLGVRQGPGKP
jgi:hypothetical protein